MEGYKGTRMSVYCELADITIVAQWDGWIDWLIDSEERLRAALEAAGGLGLVAD